MSLRPLFLALLLASGCAAPGTTRVAFEAPRGSELIFADEAGTKTLLVTFPGSGTFTQFAAEGEPSQRAVSGTLVVNQLVEEEAVPAAARSYLVDSEVGVEVPVVGSFAVHELEAAEGVEPTVSISISRRQLASLLAGEVVEVLAGDPRAFDLSLRLADR